MAINPIYYLANRSGIPRIESTAVTVGTSNVQFSFSSDVRFSSNFSGLVLVRLNQAIPSGTTTTLPVQFNSTAGGIKSLTGYDGAAITVATLAGTGIYLAYYDATSGTLQLLTGIVAAS